MGLPRRAQAGVAACLALAFVTLASSAALADHNRNSEWWLPALHVTKAWLSSRGAGVTVAVLDTGVSASQADLAGSVTTGPDFSQSGRHPGGPFWGVHGTEMASLIAGRGHGAGHTSGIIGVAPAARILSVRVTLESNDPQLADPAITARLPGAIAHGIRYAVTHGASVIDLPLDPVTRPGMAGAGGSTAERQAVSYALAHHVVLVAPAGDDGAGNDAANYPAAYPGVISVGAFNSHFFKAPYSSQRPYVTVTGPGQGVTAATPKGYAEVNSTSAASAIVAGIVAQIRAQFPRLTPAQVTKAIITTTVFRPPNSISTGSGYGTVDAQRALAAASRLSNALPHTATSAGDTATARQAAPSPPTVKAPASSLSRSLIIDAVVAGGVFLLLFAAILAFGALRRRRARSARLAEIRAAATVQPHRRAEPAVRAGARPSLAQAPPALAPGESHLAGAGLRSPGPTASPAAPAAPATFGSPTALASPTAPGSPGTLGARGSPAAGWAAGLGEPGGAFPESAFPADATRSAGEPAGGFPPPGHGVGSPGTDAPQQLPHRIPRAQQARASGSPPWGPAPPPASELPWGQVQGAPGGAAPADLSGRSSGSWEAIAEDAWPGGPRTAAPHPPAPAPASPHARPPEGGGMVPSPPGSRRPQARQPIYVWNPGGSAASGGRPDTGVPTQASPPWEIGGPAPGAGAHPGPSAVPAPSAVPGPGPVPHVSADPVGLAGPPGEGGRDPGGRPGPAEGSFTAASGRGETPLASSTGASPPVDAPFAASDSEPFSSASFGGAESGLSGYRDTRFALSGDSGGGLPEWGDGGFSGYSDSGFSGYSDSGFSGHENAGFSDASGAFPDPSAADAFSIPGGQTFGAGSFGPAPFGGAADSFASPVGDSDYPPAGAGSAPESPAGESTETFTSLAAGGRDQDAPQASESTETFPTVHPYQTRRASPPDGP